MVSKRTLRDAMDATIIGGTSATHLVRYADGGIDEVSSDSLHGAICELSVIDAKEDVLAQGTALDYDEYNGDGISISLHVKTKDMVGKLTIGGRADEVQITGSQLGRALLAVEEEALSQPDIDTPSSTDQDRPISTRMDASDTQSDTTRDTFDQKNVVLSNSMASELYEVYQDVLRTRVRKEVVNSLVQHFPSVDVTDNGCVIEGTYLVTYDAENYLVDDLDTYSVSGNTVVEHDGAKQAVGLRFDTEPYGVFTIGNEDYTLSENEQTFLATVEFLSSPSQYLEIDHFETEVYSAIREAKGDPLKRGPIQKLAQSVHVSHFIDPKSGLIHRHDIDKHVLRSTFKINQWVVDELNYSSFDHAGLAELAYREDEFKNAERAVFFDATANADPERWKEINRIEGNAPCPPEVYRTLRSKYGHK